MFKKIMLIGLLALVGCQSTIGTGQLTEVPADKQEVFDPHKPKEPLDLSEAEVLAYQQFVDVTTKYLLNDLNANENLVYSPMSFFLAMSMLEPIAFEQSLAELSAGLGQQDLQKVSQAMVKSLTFNNQVGRSFVANSLWFQKGLAFNQQRLLAIANQFKAESLEVDFTDKEKTQQLMNDWINKKTENFIKEVDVDLDARTVLALINTIYFKDAWVEKFHEELTTKDEFTQGNGSKVQVDFMNQRFFGMGYVQTDTYQAVANRLHNGGVMYFVLPNEGVSNVEFDWQEPLKYELINWSIPKFDLSSTHKLVPVAKALGIEQLFDESTADLRPFEADADRAVITNISQQARLSIDEAGVEAAAYTIIEAAPTSAQPQEPIDLIFDRPFMTILTDGHGLVLFVGWVNTIE